MPFCVSGSLFQSSVVKSLVILDGVLCQNSISHQEYDEFQQLLPLVSCSGPRNKSDLDYLGMSNVADHKNWPGGGLLLGRQVHGLDLQGMCCYGAPMTRTCVRKLCVRYNLQY